MAKFVFAQNIQGCLPYINKTSVYKLTKIFLELSTKETQRGQIMFDRLKLTLS